MSDSASRKDVEDVLSSVRRLVSSEMPRNRRPDLPKGPGALVLTDAQRVERPVSKGLAAKSLEDRIAELEAAVSSRDDEYEPDGSEDQAQHRPDKIVYTRPPTVAEQASARQDASRLNRLTLVEPVNDTAGEESSAADGETVAFRHSGSPSDSRNSADDRAEQEAPMAEDVPAVQRESAQIRAFHDPDAMLERFEARIEHGEPEQSAPAAGHDGFAEDAEAFEAEPEEVSADEPLELSSDEVGLDDLSAAEALMEPFAQDQDDTDFEEALTEAVAATHEDIAPEEKDDVPQATPELAAEEMAPAEDAASAPAVSAAMLDAIDEDVLQPIVARLIREELQGELGERITRNVRKLVRREILRALNSREFE